MFGVVTWLFVFLQIVQKGRSLSESRCTVLEIRREMNLPVFVIRSLSHTVGKIKIEIHAELSEPGKITLLVPGPLHIETNRLLIGVDVIKFLKCRNNLIDRGPIMSATKCLKYLFDASGVCRSHGDVNQRPFDGCHPNHGAGVDRLRMNF